MSYLKFENLAPGLHRIPTRVKLKTKQQYMGTTWDGFVIHEIIYVNQKDKEVVYQVFSSLEVMTAENFDSRGYEEVK